MVIAIPKVGFDRQSPLYQRIYEGFEWFMVTGLLLPTPPNEDFRPQACTTPLFFYQNKCPEYSA